MTAQPRAVLIGIQTPNHTVETLQASLDELGRLCDTLGFTVVGQVTQKRSGTEALVLLGEGKLVELAAWTGGTGKLTRGPFGKKRTGSAKLTQDEADDDYEPLDPDEIEALEQAGAPTNPDDRRADVLVVDAELSPSQLRNLQQISGVDVYDRTGVILEIFHRNARTREARLQVEIARLTYVAPRLRETGAPSERMGGKGAGESSLELDRRRIRDRIAALRKELAEIDAQRGQRRSRRRAARQVALVGYTNAGKSSLMRALTGAEPYVADQLFATLDTTIRRLQPDVVPPVLVTDTVGFIRDLPHDLVASFRSTLDAALDASLILHVVDASDDDLERQLAVTQQVLTEIEADGLPRWLVLNKCDRLTPEQRATLSERYPHGIFTSAHDPAEFTALAAQITDHFRQSLELAELFVPWALAQAIGAIHQHAEVISEDYEDEGVRYTLRAEPATVAGLRAALAR